MSRREPMVGDIYESRDWREFGRQVVVVSIDAGPDRKTCGVILQSPVATCAPWANGGRREGRLTRIQFHTLARRWRLVQSGAGTARED